MDPIKFGADLFAKAKEMQTKTVRACDVIVKIDEELSTMPEPFKMDFMCLITRAVDKCENMNNEEAGKVTPTEKVGHWVYNKNLSTHYGDVYTCSECGERCLESCYERIEKLPDFCPKCHTKMEVEE